MESLLLTTTPNVEGATIEKYYGVIMVNQVAGTGFFSDFTASFSDFFGGTSGTYRNQMYTLYEDIKKRLKDEAFKIGANAVVGITIDYDSISAKSMSMFMISARGTAVKLKYEKKHESAYPDRISFIDLECECAKRKYQDDLKNHGIDCLTEKDWNYILSHNMPNLAPLFASEYIAYRNKSIYAGTSADPYYKNLVQYFTKISYDVACDCLYDFESIENLTEIIRDANLFNPIKILELINRGNISPALYLLDVEKSSYSKDDLNAMKQIQHGLSTLPDKGTIEEVKSGLFSKGGQKFICICGQKNDIEQKYCSKCGVDIKGITEKEYNIIERFNRKTESLEYLLNHKSQDVI